MEGGGGAVARSSGGGGGFGRPHPIHFRKSEQI